MPLDKDDFTTRLVPLCEMRRRVPSAVPMLSALYIQHEAIEAQKLMINCPNHTTVYIPVGRMGVPLTGTFPAPNPK